MMVLGRKNYLFAGADTGGERAAHLSTLISTANCAASILKPIYSTF